MPDQPTPAAADAVTFTQPDATVGHVTETAVTTDIPADPPQPVQGRRHVVICGFADTRRIIPTAAEAAEMDPDGRWEWWGLNGLHRSVDVPQVPWTRWFELHDIEATQPDELLDAHMQWLRTCGIPVFIRPADIGRYGITTEVAYPHRQILDAFPPYFTNSISWMVALAILEKVDVLHVYGVDMAQDQILASEYAHQRPSAEFYLGWAAGAGVELRLPEGSDLLKTWWQYGFEQGDEFTVKLLARQQEVGHRKEQLKAEAAQLEQRMQQLRDGINQLDGAMQQNQYLLRNWAPSPDDPAQVRQVSSNGTDDGRSG